MTHLAISLFGGFRVQQDGRCLTAFGTDKNRALLAYLALESNTAHRRETLASLLWADYPAAAARNSLRQALFPLRRAIPHSEDQEPYLLVTPNQVQLNPGSDLWVDVREFSDRLASSMHHHASNLDLCETCLENLHRGIALYQGELLAGLTLGCCEQFSDWQIISQESLHNKMLAALSILSDFYEANLDFSHLIDCTQKEIELEPWRESAYRRQIWALAKIGQREQAIQQYKTLQEILQREMGILPSDGVRRLYEQIRDDLLPGTLAGRRGPAVSAPALDQPQPIFVPFAGRRSELDQLNGMLEGALSGQGRIAFVGGETGSGKTALMFEFARRAMIARSDLLVTVGTCSAYEGLGDSYQPFREVLQSLAGITDVYHADPMVSQEIGRRLKAVRPILLKALLETSPALIGTLVSAQELIRPARESKEYGETLAIKLEKLAACPDTQFDSDDYTGLSSFNDQVARLIQSVSRRFPLLILLENLQWLDHASASLLFHLGNHLADGRILILGACRTEDAAHNHEEYQPRHPLETIFHEFQRRFDQVLVDLSRADGHAFLNDCLDRIPNCFDREFRDTLYDYTQGNALFVMELLSGMQLRGEVALDDSGKWIQRGPIHWNQLPARVEAVISEQLSRLSSECLKLLRSASLQGVDFTARILAQFLGADEEEIHAQLSGALCGQHRLVKVFGPCTGPGNHPTQYRFASSLVREYLFQSLDEVEQGSSQMVASLRGL